MRISEFSSDEVSRLDNFGERSDWIELENFGSESVNVQGMGLSDDPRHPYKWTLPYTIVPPQGTLVVYASGRNQIDTTAPLHTNFRLAREGEPLLLSTADHRILDRAPPMRAPAGVSWGRPPNTDRDAPWGLHLEPTPYRPNTTEQRPTATSAGQNAVAISEVAVHGTFGFVDEDGDVPDWIEVVNRGDEAVSLAGYGLSDDLRSRSRWRFPDIVLQPGELTVVFASGKDRHGVHPHTNFRLRESEVVGLYDLDDTLIDIASTEGAREHASVGRRGPSWGPLSTATPGTDNEQAASPLQASDDLVVINEVMAAGRENPLGQDWVELHNRSGQAIELVGYGLSDRQREPFRCELPEFSLPAGGFVLITPQPHADADLHCKNGGAGFGVPAVGEALWLTDSTGSLQHQLTTGQFLSGSSSGLTDDNRRVFFSPPSPGERNQEDAFVGITPPPSIESEELLPSMLWSVSLEKRSQGDTIRCSMDGSAPTEATAECPNPIEIKDNGILRVRAFRDEHLPSITLTRTFRSEIPQSIPVMSLVVDPKEMFDPRKGMHEKGPRASEEFPHIGANFWRDRELHGHGEFFDTDGRRAVDQDLGIRIFGGYSRGMDKKSFKLVARSGYGTPRFAYPIFGPETGAWLDEWVLRAGGQDTVRTVIRDVLATRLAEGLNVDLRRHRSSVLFINGHYWGLYNIRDAIDAEKLGRPYGIGKSDVIIASGGGMKASPAFSEVRRFIRRHKPTDPEAYDWVINRVDTDSFTDWLLLQIFLNNRDGGNCIYWSAPDHGQKWRWVFFDLDLSMSSPRSRTVQATLNPDATTIPADIVTLWDWLSKNPEFREAFVNRASWMYREHLGPARVRSIIDALVAEVGPEMAREEERWPKRHGWADEMYTLHEFFEERPAQLRKQFQRRFRLTDEETEALFPATGAP